MGGHQKQPVASLAISLQEAFLCRLRQQIALVDADDDFRDARPLGQHQKAVQKQLIQIRLPGGKGDNHLVYVRHGRPQQQAFPGQAAFNHAGAILQELVLHVVTRHHCPLVPLDAPPQAAGKELIPLPACLQVVKAVIHFYYLCLCHQSNPRVIPA